MAGPRRPGVTRWVDGLVRRLEDAERAMTDGRVAEAFDGYAVVYRTLSVRWPAKVRSEDGLDRWWDGLSANAAGAPPLSESISDLLWMRVQLEREDQERRQELGVLAEDLAGRLDERDALRREARLTSVVLAVIGGEPEAPNATEALCERYPDDPWIRLELSRAFGRLRETDERDVSVAMRWAEEALEHGDGETDLYVYEDVATLLEEAGQEDELAAFERKFWTAARVERALRWYGPEPPVGTIDAAVRLGEEVVPKLIDILDDPDVRDSWQGGPDDERRTEGMWWAAVHAMRLLAALEGKAAARSVSEWLSCDIGDIRDVLPVVAARLGEAVVEPYVEVLRDRRQPLLARTSAATGLAAAAIGCPAARERVVRVLRLWMNDESAPRGLRTEIAFRLAMLADEPSRPLILAGLESGDFDGFLFDQEDIAELYGPQRGTSAPAMGLDEPPLQVYYERDAASSSVGADEAEVEAMTELLETLSEPADSPAQRQRKAAGGRTAALDRARLRLATAAMEQLGVVAWQEALDLFIGGGGRSARDCLRFALEWPFADFVALDTVDVRGDTVARRLLVEPPLMSADERQAVEALATSQVTLLEAVEGGAGRAVDAPVRCVELPEGEPVDVIMPGELLPLRWDVLLGRLVRPEGERPVLLYARRLPREQLAAATRELEDAARRIGALLPATAPPATAHRIATAAFLAQSVAATADAPAPTLRDADGADIVLCEAVYEVCDRECLADSIAHIDGFLPVYTEPDGADDEEVLAGFRWVGPEEEDPLLPNARPLFGEGVLRNGRLVLRCHTRSRLVEGREQLEAEAGDALRHRADTFTDPSGAGGQGVESSLSELTQPVEPRQARVLVSALLRRHYERWLDIVLPSLGGRSPREAAGDPSSRGDLEALVRIIENVEAHRDYAQGVCYDASPLREALGLGEGRGD